MAERSADARPPLSELTAAFAALATIDATDPGSVLGMLTERISRLSLATACTAHLVDDAEQLALAAHYPDQAVLAQLGTVQGSDGPSVEALQTGAVRRAEDLEQHTTRWPQFAPEAHRAGFRAAESVPLHGPDGILAVLTTLHIQPPALDAADRSRIVRELAVVAGQRLTDQRALSAARTEVQQLTRALNSRVLIEQAKGMLAGTNGGSPEQGFELLRRYARHRNLVLSEVAEAVVTRELELTDRDLPG